MQVIGTQQHFVPSNGGDLGLPDTRCQGQRHQAPLPRCGIISECVEFRELVRRHAGGAGLLREVTTVFELLEFLHGLPPD